VIQTEDGILCINSTLTAQTGKEVLDICSAEYPQAKQGLGVCYHL
jgi:hypothetical protein